MSSMKILITRLLEEAEPYTDNLTKALKDASPKLALTRFLDCQIVLRSGYAAAGTLTTTPEGVLRLVTLAQKQDKSPIMADHYFDYDDVLTIVIGRDLPSAAKPRSSLIIGH